MILFQVNTFSFIFLVLGFLTAILAQNKDVFVCTDGSEIKFLDVCNGKSDCSDSSDETREICHHVICPTNFFRCFYGACIAIDKKCNGVAECADKSDESQCGRSKKSCDENEFKCHESGECISINQLCDGKLHCADRSDEASHLCEDWLCPNNTFRCKRGGCIHKEAQCNGQRDCLDGSDESKELCSALKCTKNCDNIRSKITCPPITSARITTNCEVPEGPKKGVVPCDKAVPVGTIAQYECKPNYKISNAKQKGNTNSVCQMDGRWSRDFIKCAPVCGKREFDVTSLIVKGWKPPAGQWPWHAVLYMREEGKWSFSCGGTIISEKVVLTAGHCTWKIKNDDLRVGFGKSYSDYSKNEDYTEFRNVDKIILQPLYQDISGNYGSDISVLVLDKPLAFSEFIRPICLDWDGVYTREQLAPGNKGLIVGMGVTEKDTYSEDLLATYLPVIKDKQCIQEQKRDFKKYVTYTTFCAGWKNGTGVCNGDSGGGLVFQNPTDKDQWFLQGIVSISPRKHGTSFCDPSYYTVFTKVTKFLDWLTDILGDIHPNNFKGNFITDNVVF